MSPKAWPTAKTGRTAGDTVTESKPAAPSAPKRAPPSTPARNDQLPQDFDQPIPISNSLVTNRVWKRPRIEKPLPKPNRPSNTNCGAANFMRPRPGPVGVYKSSGGASACVSDAAATGAGTSARRVLNASGTITEPL